MPKIYIGYVHPQDVPHRFMKCMLTQIVAGGIPCGVDERESGPLIVTSRNELLESFLKSDCTHFLSVDTDIIWQPADTQRLLEHHKDVVGGLYMSKHEDDSQFPVCLVRNDEGIFMSAPREIILSKKLERVDAVGMGFTLIKRKVIETLGVRDLWPFAEILSKQGQPLGEDTAFCARAADDGFRIYVDPTTRVGHLKSQII